MTVELDIVAPVVSFRKLRFPPVLTKTVAMFAPAAVSSRSTLTAFAPWLTTLNAVLNRSVVNVLDSVLDAYARPPLAVTIAALEPANTSADCTAVPWDVVQFDRFPDSNPSENAVDVVVTFS